MKKLLIILGALSLLGLLIFGFRTAYLYDKQQEQFLYETCREQSCSDAECKIFSTYLGSVTIRCPNGNRISQEWGW